MSQVLNFVKYTQPPNDGKLKNEKGFPNFTPIQDIRPHSI